MNSRQDMLSRKRIDRPLTVDCLLLPFKYIGLGFTNYNTAKVVRFQATWIASLSRFVKVSLAFGIMYLLVQQAAYQETDRSPISAVTIEVKRSDYCSRNSSVIKAFSNYDCSQSTYDIHDFILPPTENSAISIITRSIETEHVLKACNDIMLEKIKTKCSPFYATALHNCSVISHCIVPPHYRRIEYENEINETHYRRREYENEIKIKTPLCWFRSPTTHVKRNYQALDYILFIKNYVEFPLPNFKRTNIEIEFPNKSYIETCEYDPMEHPLCPKFRILKILQMIENNTNEYESMFFYGSLIEIKITWKCNLDKPLKNCKPRYQFYRLDYNSYKQHPYQPGSQFLTARHFFESDDHELHRIHTEIYNLHILVSVTGEVGKFSLFQTTTSIGSFIGIFSMGTMLCDLIARVVKKFRIVKFG